MHLGELLQRADPAETEVIGLHVEHGADVAVADAHPRAEQTPARHLEHVDQRTHVDVVSALRHELARARDAADEREPTEHVGA